MSDPILPHDQGAADDINAFQGWMRAVPHPQGQGLSHLALMAITLGEESGEVIGKLKKHLRDGTPIDLPHLVMEMADVIIVISSIASEMNVPMSEVLKAGKRKMQGRIERDTMRGSGDDR